MHSRFSCFRWFGGIVLALAMGSALPVRAEVELIHQLDTGWGFTVSYPDDWSVVDDQFVNSYTLVNVPADLQGQAPITARVKVYREQRRDHREALSRLGSEASVVKASPSAFVEVSGWPALRSLRVESRPQPNRGARFDSDRVLRANTWVAAGKLLIQVHATLPTEASDELIAQAEAIAASVATTEVARSARTREELEKLRTEAAKAAQPGAARPQAPQAAAGDLARGIAAFPKLQTPPSTFNQRIFAGGFGELEIAVSDNGQVLVVGRQSAWVASTDGGNTFPDSGFINAFDGGDPSLATGASGAFYYAGIDRNCHNSNYLNPPPALGFGQDCTGIARSTDNGASFPIGNTNPAVACPRDDPNNPNTVANRCFPDQEHIAADRFNAGGGGDQVYSTWRNFDAVDQDGALVCTQDSGVNWTAPFDLGPNSFFPRISVGGDGFVYVIAIGAANYRLWKFSSCANGLTLQPGFPVSVFPIDPVDCPFAGHDRCDQNPSSQTVVVDDGNPNHVYFAVADADGSSNRDGSIFVLDSLDGGLTWGGSCSLSATQCYFESDCPAAEVCLGRTAVRAHPAIPGPRIMPWLCATGGDAYVTWFDRRAATPCPGGNCPGPQNDLTHYYAARVGLDASGTLVPKGEFRVSEVQHPWCGPANTPWPAPTRQALTPPPGASEACSLQPQLGGQCCMDLVDGMGNPGADGACDAGTATGTPCDVSDDNPGARCNAGEVCLGGGGVPRYGDYNGNACIAGRLYTAWPSATSPPAVPPANPGAEGILFDAFLVGDIPLMTIPASVDFGAVCGEGPHTATLEVCNTGNANLLVTSISSADADFEVNDPSSGFPVQISPDFCFPFEVSFDAAVSGAADTVLTVNSNDPVGPVEVAVSAHVGTGDLQLAIANSGDFGEVCTGDFSDLNLTLFNQGSCNLSIAGITVDDPRFVLPEQVDYPLILSPDADFNFPVRFVPDACGEDPVTAVLTIDNDENEVFASGFESHEAGKSRAASAMIAPKVLTQVQLTASAPCPNLVIDPAGLSGLAAFPTTVVDSTGTLGCFSERSVVLRNSGSCPLTIADISAAGADFTVQAPTGFPLLLPPGEETLEATVRFAPLADADALAPSEVLGTLTIASDDPGAPHLADLCGESAAQSGVRLLVTDVTSGTPVVVDEVDRITIKSHGQNTPSPVNLRFTDQAPTTAMICGQDVVYHVNRETLPAAATTGNNPKSSYELHAKEGNLQTTQTHELGQCDFLDLQLQLQSSSTQ